ncbi:hypothetical protein N7520_004373 [Penicillium odoratum]|uniref:uncharacterized protein n=1 Tax=Penicillium odoratum TaxID=1167516 RepID=UPI0025474E57|nr:uncharacterized protein N7520_004373 [Penicillium odoratum]KAJ5764814.1 hypothetical protein N7520_004373 [Penicillium odoratum]
MESTNPSVLPVQAEKRLCKFRHTTAIPFDTVSRIKEFCNREEIEVLNLLQLAWAIVLRGYLSSDSICFSYREGKDKDSVYSLDFTSRDLITSILRNEHASNKHRAANGSPNTVDCDSLFKIFHSLLELQNHEEFLPDTASAYDTKVADDCRETSADMNTLV